jgi:hypothetical protein
MIAAKAGIQMRVQLTRVGSGATALASVVVASEYREAEPLPPLSRPTLSATLRIAALAVDTVALLLARWAVRTAAVEYAEARVADPGHLRPLISFP